MTDMAHRGWQMTETILFERDIYVLLMWWSITTRAIPTY